MKDINNDEVHIDDIVMISIKKDKRKGYQKYMDGLYKGNIIEKDEKSYVKFADDIVHCLAGLIPLGNVDFIKIIGNKTEGEFEVAKMFVHEGEADKRHKGAIKCN